MRSINSDTKDVERIVDRLVHRQVIDEAQRDEWVKNLKSMSRNKRKVLRVANSSQ